MSWWWAGAVGAVKKRQDESAAATKPSFKSVALILCSTGIIGTSLLDILPRDDTLGGQWKSVAEALGSLADVTHVAWSSHSIDDQNREVNAGMLRNVLVLALRSAMHGMGTGSAMIPRPSTEPDIYAISVFGSKLQKKMRDSNIFVVGSGALGCEFLKNFALMGLFCGRKGELTIIDDYVIEKSNLSRQFLFRDWNIGQAKSTVSATAASAINSSLHIDALQNRACPETELVLNDAFLEGLDAVINALDNVNARIYVDMGCLYFQKPFLESGTLGPKCNTQMVIPHLTENYGASRDPPEKQAPMCTVHYFPHNIDHCLTWARSKFEDYFSNRVKQLTFAFPEDAATSTGASYWSAPKRFPHPVQFSAVDSSHIQFILASSILRAMSFGIPIPDWVNNIPDWVSFGIPIPDWPI
uniref:Ubiquitin-activating enzyme E1 3 n=1 Tax=Aegilops tauschii TaxID=37682 RepID=M8BGW3_AEGTA